MIVSLNSFSFKDPKLQKRWADPNHEFINPGERVATRFQLLSLRLKPILPQIKEFKIYFPKGTYSQVCIKEIVLKFWLIIEG